MCAETSEISHVCSAPYNILLLLRSLCSAEAEQGARENRAERLQLFNTPAVSSENFVTDLTDSPEVNRRTVHGEDRIITDYDCEFFACKTNRN